MRASRVESDRVERTVPVTSRAVFIPSSTYICEVRARALTLTTLRTYRDPHALTRTLVRAAYADGLRFDSGGYRIGRRYYP